jgi:hypothetical protein
VPKEQLALGAVAVLFVVIFLGVSMPLVVNVVGFGPPAALALQAHLGPASAQEAAFLKKNWMSYFVLLGAFTVLETYSTALLGLFKYYYALKLAVLVWAMSPQWRGAACLFDVAAPFLTVLHEATPKKVD